jgi:antitoxin component YwqK of YwqJK toxin-antitoxin module
MKAIVFLLFITHFVNSQNFNQLDEKGNKHGIWKGNYPESKRPRYEGVFDHGKEIGLFKFFDDTKAGTLIATREFDAKDNSCYTIFYNQKSNKVSEGKVVNKLFEGEWKYYHENSPEIMTIEFYSKGKLNGVRTVFYKSGKIAEETSYSNGLKEGSYKKYTENSIVLEESSFKNNEYEGLAIYRDATNQIVAQGIYKYGKKIGLWKIFEKGKMKEVNMNKQGKKFQKRTKPLEPEQK